MDSPTLTGNRQYDAQMAAVDQVTQFLCCCSILNESLGPSQHLDDCELRLLTGEYSTRLSEGSDSNSSVDSNESVDRRRKHRESMARLRQKLRESIGTLKQQEERLAQELKRTVNQFQPKEEGSPSSADTRLKLRQAYFELVREQLALQEERRGLDVTWLEKDKYERLVQREMLRMNDAAQEAAEENERGE